MTAHPTPSPALPQVGAVARHHIPCPLCAHDDRRPFCPQNGRGLVQCAACGMVYVGARASAEDLASLYSADYFRSADSGTVGYSDYLHDEPHIRRTFAGRLRWLTRHVAPGRLLDVGCAAGFFLDEAAKRGWQVEGVDVSPFAVQTVRERFGYDAHLGSLEAQTHLPEAAYDLITLWDVIEHVPDPHATIARAAALLRPGGVIVLATPDVASLPARLAGKRWVGYKLSDEHVTYFSPATLTRLLNDHGLAVEHTRHVGKVVTLALFTDRLGLYLPWLGRALARLTHALRLDQLALYVNPLDIVAVVARKPA